MRRFITRDKVALCKSFYKHFNQSQYEFRSRSCPSEVPMLLQVVFPQCKSEIDKTLGGVILNKKLMASLWWEFKLCILWVWNQLLHQFAGPGDNRVYAVGRRPVKQVKLTMVSTCLRGRLLLGACSRQRHKEIERDISTCNTLTVTVMSFLRHCMSSALMLCWSCPQCHSLP